jgi:predicted amino acid-binding ACT domain protein
MIICSLVATCGSTLDTKIIIFIDLIRGLARDEDENTSASIFRSKNGPNRQLDLTGAHKVVVTSENELVVIGVNANDRPGLLLDVSKGLSRLNLNLRHTEASVVQQRSLSIWRCELINSEIADLEEIWSVLNVSFSMTFISNPL